MATVIERNINLKLASDTMSTAVLNPIFMDDDFRRFFMVDTDAKTKKKIPFVGYKADLLRRATGCTPEQVDLLEIDARCFDIHEHASRASLCYDQFKNTLFLGGMNTGVNKANMLNTDIAGMMVEAYQIGIRKDLSNTAWFGKRSMTEQAGYVHLTVTDGVWPVYIPQMQTEGTLQETIENATLVPGSGDTIKYLRSIVNNQKTVLEATEDSKKFLAVDKGVYRAYKADLEAINNLGGYTESTENGRRMLTFDNIAVIQMLEWDTVLTGLGIDLAVTPANFAILTTNQNLWFGTDSSDQSQELDIWYDKKDKLNNIDSAFSIGFNYLHADFFSVGFSQTVLDALAAL